MVTMLSHFVIIRSHVFESIKVHLLVLGSRALASSRKLTISWSVYRRAKFLPIISFMDFTNAESLSQIVKCFFSFPSNGKIRLAVGDFSSLFLRYNDLVCDYKLPLAHMLDDLFHTIG